MAANTNNYTQIKGKFGGCVGSIQVHATPYIQGSNDPNTDPFKQHIPAGYLKCDGSIQNKSEYYALGEVLGVGDESKFKKENVTLRPEDTETGELGQFQLPDLGSKVLIPNRSVGQYFNDLTEQDGSNRVGPEVEVFSNEGNSLRCDFVGNFVGNPIQTNYDFNSNPKYVFETISSETTLDIENFQGHAHNVTGVGYVNYSAQHQTGGDGKDGGNFSGNSGAGNVLEISDINSTILSTHSHKITKPVTYTHNFQYQHSTFDIPADGVYTTLNIGVEDITKLNNVSTPFIIVSYIIKF